MATLITTPELESRDLITDNYWFVVYLSGRYENTLQAEGFETLAAARERARELITDYHHKHVSVCSREYDCRCRAAWDVIAHDNDE